MIYSIPKVPRNLQSYKSIHELSRLFWIDWTLQSRSITIGGIIKAHNIATFKMRIPDHSNSPHSVGFLTLIKAVFYIPIFIFGE